MFTRVAAYLQTQALNIFSSLQGGAVFPPAARRALFRLAGYKLGRDVRIMQGVFIGGHQLVFGSNVLVAARCHLGGGGRITLSDGVTLSANVTVTSSTHRIGGPEQRCGEHYTGDVTIEPGCWIGIGATVLPGVTIGAGSVVAAGAVVTRSLPPNGFYAGMPARRMRSLDAEEDRIAVTG